MIWAFDLARSRSVLVVFAFVSVIRFSVVVLFGRVDCSVVWLLASRSFVKSFGRYAWDLAVVHLFGHSDVRSFAVWLFGSLVAVFWAVFRWSFSCEFFLLRASSLNTRIKTQREIFFRISKYFPIVFYFSCVLIYYSRQQHHHVGLISMILLLLFFSNQITDSI